MSQVAKSRTRIESLDGLRGLAIVLVVLFHAYARWPDKVPYLTSNYGEFILFKNGFLGVELFFLISGFVIYMTLESCFGFIEVIYKRWLRLFPAMLISTVLIFLTSSLLPERPAGEPNFLSVVPGLFFIEPWVFEKFFNIKITPLEGVFWSLYVEIKFYLVFGALYFFNKEKALFRFILIYLLYFILRQISQISGTFDYLSKICDTANHILSINHFGWFGIGALIFQYYKSENKTLLAAAFLLLPISYLTSHGFLKPNLISFAIVSILFLIFVSSIFEGLVSRLLQSRPLVFLGFISYPLYLIHENSMIALTVKLNSIIKFHEVMSFFLPLLVLILIASFAYFIASYGEPFVRKTLKRAVIFFAD